MDQDPFVLDQQLCFALHAATRAVSASYRWRLAAIGLTYSQYTVMLVLWEHERVGLSELGQRLQLDSGTLSPLVRRLEQAGFVTRERGGVDERVVHVGITKAGNGLRAAAAEARDVMVEATGLDPEELVELRGTLQAVTARLRVAERAGTAPR